MSRKGENIYKRKDGRWEGRYIKSRNNNGKIIYGYVYAKTYREVKNKLCQNLASYPTSASIHYAAATTVKQNLFSSVALDWFENIQLHVKESTKNKYQNMLVHYILPVYGKLALDSVTYDFIETQCNFLLISGGKKRKRFVSQDSN